MTRMFEGGKLVIASHNPGKILELRDLLGVFGIDTDSAAELDLAEPEETGQTFEDNARIKAIAAAKVTNLPSLADDSGLEVKALGSAPGVHSARWAGPERNFAEAMERVHQRMKSHMDASARFVCILALAWPDGHADCFKGTVEGNITWPPRGELGFGYDPMFVPVGYDETFGEMDPAFKHAMSHRAVALRKLIYGCFAR